ncbi:hypothetical protein ACQP1G_00690 [Nocardia sp. CA-107356]|uniref:hypothetical protein n=1 Tax=Nocardia sp. CA-107356 TaxID=3239972 RepID=UPI003D89B1C8
MAQRKPPATVRGSALIMFVVAVACAVAALFLFFGDAKEMDLASGMAKLLGVVAVCLAAVLAAVAITLWLGNPRGRDATVGLAALLGANGVVMLFDSESDSLGFGIAVLGIVTLMAGLLFASSARAYYGRWE